MQSTCLLVLIAAFVGIVAGLSMDKRERFLAKELLRRIYKENDESMLDNLKSRDVGKRVHYRMEKRDGSVKWMKIASEEAIADSECPNIEIVQGKTLEQCKQACETKPGCTGFNMETHGKECVLRACTANNAFPPNVVPWPNYDVWVICKNGQWFKLGSQEAIADDECENTQIIPTLTLDDCKKICEGKDGCNALNMEVNNKECILRQCSDSKFPPKVVPWPNYDAWAECKDATPTATIATLAPITKTPLRPSCSSCCSLPPYTYCDRNGITCVCSCAFTGLCGATITPSPNYCRAYGTYGGGGNLYPYSTVFCPRNYTAPFTGSDGLRLGADGGYIYPPGYVGYDAVNDRGYYDNRFYYCSTCG